MAQGSGSSDGSVLGSAEGVAVAVGSAGSAGQQVGSASGSSVGVGSSVAQVGSGLVAGLVTGLVAGLGLAGLVSRLVRLRLGRRVRRLARRRHRGGARGRVGRNGPGCHRRWVARSRWRSSRTPTSTPPRLRRARRRRPRSGGSAGCLGLRRREERRRRPRSEGRRRCEPGDVGGVEDGLPGEHEPQVVTRVVVGEHRLFESLAGAEVTTAVAEVDHRGARSVVHVLRVAEPVAVRVHPGGSPAGRQQLHRADGPVPGPVAVPLAAVGVRDLGVRRAVEDWPEHTGRHPVVRVDPLTLEVARLDLPDGCHQRQREVAAGRGQGHRQGVGVHELWADALVGRGNCSRAVGPPPRVGGERSLDDQRLLRRRDSHGSLLQGALRRRRALGSIGRAPDRLTAEQNHQHAECQHGTLGLAPHWVLNFHRSDHRMLRRKCRHRERLATVTGAADVQKNSSG